LRRARALNDLLQPALTALLPEYQVLLGLAFDLLMKPNWQQTLFLLIIFRLYPTEALAIAMANWRDEHELCSNFVTIS
jgi:hypothetical protein